MGNVGGVLSDNYLFLWAFTSKGFASSFSIAGNPFLIGYEIWQVRQMTFSCASSKETSDLHAGQARILSSCFFSIVCSFQLWKSYELRFYHVLIAFVVVE